MGNLLSGRIQNFLSGSNFAALCPIALLLNFGVQSIERIFIFPSTGPTSCSQFDHQVPAAEIKIEPSVFLHTFKKFERPHVDTCPLHDALHGNPGRPQNELRVLAMSNIEVNDHTQEGSNSVIKQVRPSLFGKVLRTFLEAPSAIG